MHLKKHRKIMFTLTILYTLFILYFLFFAFGRAGKADQISEYTFMFLPDGFFRLPDLSDLLHPTLMDFVGFGNIAAFIPFGILIPLLYRVSFVRFMTLFILSILVLETIQAFTFLGSFDINDVIQNSTGAAIGFGAYKLGFRTKKDLRNIAVAVISGIVLMIGVWGVFGVLDQVFTKEMGPFVAIHEWEDGTGVPITGTELAPLKIGGEEVQPQYNVYRSEGKGKETLTYKLGNKKELYLYFNYGIPDHLDSQGSIKVTVDGQEVLSASAEAGRHEQGMGSILIEQGNELTIIIEGDEALWDVGYREMVYSWE
ncbi:VanZ family protein [Fontibacillus sp. BL9]|uniref:VanZ family protein n=1 Tax=Fontibacillus sp. BL9 TaxID=3389971 RepID=UPI00397E1717